MKIVPLGTSSGQPTLERNVSGLAAYVGSDSRWVMVDCGEGTQQRMMRAKPALSWSDLDAILITHTHGDHCFGIFGVLAALSMSGRTRPLKLVAPHEVKTMAETVLKASHTHLSYALDWTEPVDTLVISLSDRLEATCIKMSHRAPSHGYLLSSSKVVLNVDGEAFARAGYKEDPERGRAVSCAKLGEPSVAPGGQGSVDMTHAVSFKRHVESLFVGGDNLEPLRVAQAAAGACVWVHEATYVHEDWEREGMGVKWGHSSARMVGEAAAIGKPGALVLTHFSPRYGAGVLGVERLRAEAQEAFGGRVEIAQDLEVLEFKPRIESCARPESARQSARRQQR